MWVNKHPLAIRWFHWINFPVLAVMIWSGLQIYWANVVYRIGIGDFTLLKFFPERFYATFNIGYRLAEGMAWHFTFMWLFAINGLLYESYTLLSGEWRYLAPFSKTQPRKKFNSAQQWAYTGIIVIGAGSLLTGLAVYKPIQLSWLAAIMGGYQSARFLHFWLTVAFVLFFFVHVAQVARSGWNNFQTMITGSEVIKLEKVTND